MEEYERQVAIDDAAAIACSQIELKQAMDPFSMLYDHDDESKPPKLNIAAYSPLPNDDPGMFVITDSSYDPDITEEDQNVVQRYQRERVDTMRSGATYQRYYAKFLQYLSARNIDLKSVTYETLFSYLRALIEDKTYSSPTSYFTVNSAIRAKLLV